MTAAWTHPIEFVRVVASLIPRELEATIAPVTERMSNAHRSFSRSVRSLRRRACAALIVLLLLAPKRTFRLALTNV